MNEINPAAPSWGESAHHPLVTAVFNQKGGIGKTTTSVNLAICLAALGRNVVLLDFDSQGNATASLGFAAVPVIGAYDVMTGRACLADALYPTRYPNLRLCPSTDDLAAVDIELSVDERPQSVLARRLAEAPPDCDYIIIDCPPALGLLPVNALAAAHGVVVPVSPHPLSHDGLLKAWHHIDVIRTHLNHHLVVHGILVTFVNERDDTITMVNLLRDEFGARVYDTMVPADDMVITASARYLPIVIHAPDSPAARAFQAFTTEFLHREPAMSLRSTAAESGDPAPDTARDATADALRKSLALWHHALGQSDDAVLPQPAPALQGWMSENEAKPSRLTPGLVVGLVLMALSGGIAIGVMMSSIAPDLARLLGHSG